MAKLEVIEDVVSRHMCTGCGACAYINPAEIRMVDDFELGRRPLVSRRSEVDSPLEQETRVCPGRLLERRPDEIPEGADPALLPGWGAVLEVWEGYASDDEIRYSASSGGAASALALYCIERGGMHGALHIGARSDVPYLNETRMSRTREDLLAATGSRYAPASPCDGLAQIESAPAPSVFIGKPCDVAAAGEARRLRPALDEKLGLAIAFFCAGTPSTRGTLELMKQMGVADATQVSSMRYRGLGWPGLARVRYEQGAEIAESTHTYAESWGFVQRYRQWRCYVCADHTGELADVSVGDPWYRDIGEGEIGSSLIVARTERGRAIVHAAVEAGYLIAERASSDLVAASQRELLGGRGAVWGRIWMTRLMGVAVPTYRGFPLFRFWWSALSLKQKAQSFYGTAKRVFTKKLRQRGVVRETELPRQRDKR